MDVTAVVRLNDEHYDAFEFMNAGFAHYELFFEDCTVPSFAIVERFLDLCDQHRTIAVHCFAGLGRTGTLIALWMMKHKNFSAKESIAWLRLVRPGNPFAELIQTMLLPLRVTEHFCLGLPRLCDWTPAKVLEHVRAPGMARQQAQNAPD